MRLHRVHAAAGLLSLNVSNPANPYEVGFYDTPGGAEGVAVAGDYAYVADGEGGLDIIWTMLSGVR
ncbi:MAG: hypothetical protein C4309_03625 [Chloroflexota bacterium]